MKFELKPEHIKLLSSAYIGWNDAEYGAPEIDPKRPYGNSDVEEDICDILGWDRKEDLEKARDIHVETRVALEIILNTQKFETGIYESHLDKSYNIKWEKINEKQHDPNEAIRIAMKEPVAQTDYKTKDPNWINPKIPTGPTKEEFIDQVVEEEFDRKWSYCRDTCFSESQKIELEEKLKNILKKLL